jgi:hypothetical protein
MNKNLDMQKFNCMQIENKKLKFFVQKEGDQVPNIPTDFKSDEG